jgi:hypothetical protein
VECPAVRHAPLEQRVAEPRTRTGEEEHVGDAVLIARRVFAKNEDRAMCARNR